MVFNHYAGVKSIMNGAQFHDFACNCQFVGEGAQDADSFFQKAVGSQYRETVKISADRFVAALVRTFEGMSANRRIKPAHACSVMVRDHIAPHTREMFGHIQEPHSHAASYG